MGVCVRVGCKRGYGGRKKGLVGLGARVQGHGGAASCARVIVEMGARVGRDLMVGMGARARVMVGLGARANVAMMGVGARGHRYGGSGRTQGEEHCGPRARAWRVMVGVGTCARRDMVGVGASARRDIRWSWGRVNVAMVGVGTCERRGVIDLAHAGRGVGV